MRPWWKKCEHFSLFFFLFFSPRRVRDIGEMDNTTLAWLAVFLATCSTELITKDTKLTQNCCCSLPPFLQFPPWLKTPQPSQTGQANPNTPCTTKNGKIVSFFLSFFLLPSSLDKISERKGGKNLFFLQPCISETEDMADWDVLSCLCQHSPSSSWPIVISQHG